METPNPRTLLLAVSLRTGLFWAVNGKALWRISSNLKPLQVLLLNWGRCILKPLCNEVIHLLNAKRQRTHLIVKCFATINRITKQRYKFTSSNALLQSTEFTKQRMSNALLQSTEFTKQRMSNALLQSLENTDTGPALTKLCHLRYC